MEREYGAVQGGPRAHLAGLADVGVRAGEAGSPEPQRVAWPGVCVPQSPHCTPELCVGLGAGEGLFGSRRLSDNWKVPVLARPSVPVRLAPGRLLPTPEGPQSSAGEAAETGREGQAEAHLAFVYSHLIFGSCALDDLPGA